MGQRDAAVCSGGEHSSVAAMQSTPEQLVGANSSPRVKTKHAMIPQLSEERKFKPATEDAVSYLQHFRI